MKLSKRLSRIVEMAGRGDTVADIGTDHGYVPIALVQSGRFQRAVAMDVRQGPLDRAGEHISANGLEEKISLRLSEGLGELAPGEADTILICGMGGGLIKRILQEGEAAARGASRLLLAPQSDPGMFRRYLLSHGYDILTEDLVEEDGKFYPLLLCAPGTGAGWSEEEYEYGREPLLAAHPVLKRMLQKELRVLGEIAKNLGGVDTTAGKRRLREVEARRQLAAHALSRMEEGSKRTERKTGGDTDD